MYNLENTGTVTHCCYDRLIFKKAAAMLGGNVRAIGTGGAPMEKSVSSFLKICFSCPITDGYGMTEVSGTISKSSTEDLIVDHVGGPHNLIKFRLKSLPDLNYLVTDMPYPRGELLLKGPSIFSGYFKQEQKTQEAFDA